MFRRFGRRDQFGMAQAVDGMLSDDTRGISLSGPLNRFFSGIAPDHKRDVPSLKLDDPLICRYRNGWLCFEKRMVRCRLASLVSPTVRSLADKSALASRAQAVALVRIIHGNKQ